MIYMFFQIKRKTRKYSGERKHFFKYVILVYLLFLPFMPFQLLLLHFFRVCILYKGEQDSQIWMPDIWHFLGFSDFFLWSPPWNNENKSCLNDIKFWEVSGNLKTSRFWKLQLSMSSGTQKSAKNPLPVAKMIWSFREKNVMNSLQDLWAVMELIHGVLTVSL